MNSFQHLLWKTRLKYHLWNISRKKDERPLIEKLREHDISKQETYQDHLIWEEPEKGMIKGYVNTGNVYVGDYRLDITESFEVLPEAWDFSWGYEGAGPQQLAMALLLVYVPKLQVGVYYNDFLSEIVAKIPNNKNFSIPEGAIKQWLRKKEKEIFREGDHLPLLDY